ncbi:MAG: energy-coupling factor transporter ATPase [Clostridia bacterium]|nr:energy-coupling factor transporter ATPase [Clostridia bacterium]MBO4429619.1 energy-coupling factor transporter ATPase [Clostridia bacterium]
MPVIELRNVSFIYSKDTPFEKTAVSDMTFAFEEGITTGIIGHTGSGKSTVAQMLNGLLRPTDGEIFVMGKNIWEEPKKIKDVRFKVGLVFQYPEYQLFEETVRADISFGPKNMKLDKDEIERRVEESADFVGIPREMLDRSPFELSGGEKRRVAIAGVIAMRPDVLILDEPAAGLDPRGRDEILTRIADYGKQTGSTVVMISHSMEDMARYCDKILVMNGGKPYMYGTPGEIFADPDKIEAVGLGVPQITKLMKRLRDMGCDVSTSVYTVEDAKAEIIRAIGGDANA